MTSEQVTTIIMGILVLAGHYLNYRASMDIKQHLTEVKKHVVGDTKPIKSAPLP